MSVGLVLNICKIIMLEPLFIEAVCIELGGKASRMLSRRSRLKRAHRMEQYVEGICRCRWVARGFSRVPEARVQIPTELEGEKRSELWRGTEREGGENRKPTGAEFASSKATSDYFI